MLLRALSRLSRIKAVGLIRLTRILKFTDYSETVKVLIWMLGSAAVIGIVFSAFQAAAEWAVFSSVALVIVFSWAQGQRLVKANKQRKLQTQDLAVGLARTDLALLPGDGSFSHKIADTKFHEDSFLKLRASLNAPFFRDIETEMLLVLRPLDRLRKNAIQVYVSELEIGWLEVAKQSEVIEMLDSVDGIAKVKGKVTFGLKAESHSAFIDLDLDD